MGRLSVSSFALVAAFLFSAVSALQPGAVKGSNFINNATGDRIQIVGVDYQPGGQSDFGNGVDPLSNATVCLRDAILMQRLGVNTIRIYNLDPDLNHDECASIFNAAGIYMILDVNSPLPNQSLNRAAPWESYTSDYLTRIFQVVENFSPYPNVLGFFGGNEVINEDSVVQVPAYLRAVTRDLKDYISNHVSREIGVGYSAADVRSVLADTWNYLGCSLSNATSSKIDFFGLNSYSWCGDSSYTTSGYDQLVAQFSNTTIPVFFSEYGCNKVLPRVFTEVPVLYGPQMTILSGGLVYEYSQEVSNYGLVILNDNNTVSLRVDYVNLQNQYDKLDLKLLTSANESATSLTAPSCNPDLITSQGFLNNWTIPARPPGGDDLVSNGVNGTKGQLVDVNNLNMPVTVYNVDGSELTSLKLIKLPNNEANTPGSNNGSSSSTSTSSGAKPTSKSAGVSVYNGQSNLALLGVGILGLLLS